MAAKKRSAKKFAKKAAVKKKRKPMTPLEKTKVVQIVQAPAGQLARVFGAYGATA